MKLGFWCREIPPKLKIKIIIGIYETETAIP